MKNTPIKTKSIIKITAITKITFDISYPKNSILGIIENATSPTKTESTSRCTPLKNFEIKIIAILNKKGNTRPIDESSCNVVFWLISSVKKTVNIPTSPAPIISNGLVKSLVIKKAITIPSKIVCVIESIIMDIFLRIKNGPNNEQAAETKLTANKISNCLI